MDKNFTVLGVAKGKAHKNKSDTLEGRANSSKHDRRKKGKQPKQNSESAEMSEN